MHRDTVFARGIHFHVTEAGAGVPVLALHGWPQHHYAFRDLLASPPPGMRIIAPDLPGFGWSGPPPHAWGKKDVADDLVTLLDALGIEAAIVLGHDWGGWIGQVMALENPERVTGLLPVNIAHLWQGSGGAAQLARTAPALARTALYQPVIAGIGVPLQRHTPVISAVFARERRIPGFGDETARIYARRFRDPVCARAATLAYRTFVTRELPQRLRAPETRISTTPTRALFGTADPALRPALADPRTALAEDYRLELVDGCGHFLPEERPELLRARLTALVAERGPAIVPPSVAEEAPCSTS
nr:alpha/beta hydrolase [Tsukamurella sp. 1534]